MKQISFDFTADDFVQFNLFHNRHSPEVRRRYLIGWATIPIIMWTLFLLLPVVLRRDGQTWWQGMMAMKWYFAAPLLIIAYYPWATRRRVAGLLHKMLREGSNGSLLGPRTVMIDDKRITSQSASSTNSVAWVGVNRIARSADCGYIYTSSVSAVVVPRRAFQSAGDFMAFLDAADAARLAATR